MKLNQWTMALASAGVVSLASVAQAEEAMNPVLSTISSTTLSGYVDTSAIWKLGTGSDGQWDPSSPNDSIPGRAFDNNGQLDGFNLEVVSVSLSKPLGEEQWAAGYDVQLLFGPNAVAYNPSNNSDGTSDFAIKNANVDLRVPIGNGLDFQMGVFDTIIGYEVFDSYLDPNFSRSYGWVLEPTQNTGLLTSYQFSEVFSMSGGIANVLQPGINTRSPRGETFKAYMASLAVTAPDSWGVMAGSSLYAGFVNGYAGNTRDTSNFYLGATVMTPVDGLAVGLAYDYRSNGPNSYGFSDTNWAWALAGYVTFEATEKWTLTGRLDYTDAADGTYYDGGTPGLKDQDNQMMSLTLTADYALWANVLTRGEFRWDRCLSDDSPYANASGTGSGDQNALTLTANVVFVF